MGSYVSFLQAIHCYPNLKYIFVLRDNHFTGTTKETVYESCSSDENEDQGTNNENVDNNKRFKSEENTAEIKSKASNEEVVKTQSQKTKQASIMSFFKKPSKA